MSFQNKDEYIDQRKVFASEAEYSDYENQILRLNTVLRVDSYERTPYSIHMSYPSARSLYTIRVYMVREDFFLTKDLWGNNKVFYPSAGTRRQLRVDTGDIVLSLLPFQDIHYPSLFKTLQNLEVGHMIYNINYFAEQFGKEYLADNNHPSCLILRQTNSGSVQPGDYSTIQRFWEKAVLRTSGKYYGGLINFDGDHRKYRYALSEITNLSNIRFTDSLGENIRVLDLVNEGSEYVNDEYGLTCSFDYLMQEYSYVHFRSQSQITLVLLRWPLPERKNYADLIQYMGAIAQKVCIENACKEVYNRPIKQMNHSFWKPILDQNTELNNYIPFYGIITGKDSIVS